MNHSTPQVIIDLEEYQSLLKQIDQLKAPGIEQELTPAEQQEATGKLLSVALNNPGVFRGNREVDLGKFVASIASITDTTNTIKLLVRFKRK